MSDGISSVRAFSVRFSLKEVSEISYFTGREQELTEIHRALSQEDGRHVVVLHGMGGIGKTQMTVAYATRHQKEYSAIFWLNCKDEDSLKQSYLRAAQRILREHPSTVGLAAAKEDKNLEDVVDAVRDWFDQRNNTRWLLIYDNYDRPKLPGSEDPLAIDLRRYLPDMSPGSIIITTRLAQVALGHRMEVKKLGNIRDSLQILALTSDRPNVMEGQSTLTLLLLIGGGANKVNR